MDFRKEIAFCRPDRSEYSIKTSENTGSLVANADHLADPFGQALDGNGDGKGGDDLVLPFYVAPKPAPKPPAKPPVQDPVPQDPKTLVFS